MRIDKRLIDALPKGTLSMLMKLPAAQGRAQDAPRRLRHPRGGHRARRASPRSSTRATPSARSRARASRCPRSTTYAEKLWDYWERNLDPDLFKDRSFEAAVNGKTVADHRRLVGHRPRGRDQDRARPAASRCSSPAAMDKLEEAKAEIEAAGGTAYVYSADLSDMDVDRGARRARCSPTTRASTCSSTTPAARSGARSRSAYDRFHDYERTMQLNYFGAIKLIIGLLPHMREQRVGPHRQRLLDRRADQPAAVQRLRRLQGRARRLHARVATEIVGDGVTFTTIHMPLVRTPMIAPTKIYDSFPTITPDEAADMVCEAIRAKPKQISTRLGTFGEVAYALAPKAVDQILHMAYKVFPDSAAARARRTRRRAGLGRADRARAPDARRPLVARGAVVHEQLDEPVPA